MFRLGKSVERKSKLGITYAVKTVNGTQDLKGGGDEKVPKLLKSLNCASEMGKFCT